MSLCLWFSNISNLIIATVVSHKVKLGGVLNKHEKYVVYFVNCLSIIIVPLLYLQVCQTPPVWLYCKANIIITQHYTTCNFYLIMFYMCGEGKRYAPNIVVVADKNLFGIKISMFFMSSMCQFRRNRTN